MIRIDYTTEVNDVLENLFMWFIVFFGASL